jgi:hypothetical protein
MLNSYRFAFDPLSCQRAGSDSRTTSKRLELCIYYLAIFIHFDLMITINAPQSIQVKRLHILKPQYHIPYMNKLGYYQCSPGLITVLFLNLRHT